MSFGEAIKSVFSKYATFSGRARRSEFWFFYLFNFLVSLVLGIIPVLSWVSGLWALAVLIPSLAVTVRRFHDIGKSGWWYLFTLIPGLACAGYMLSIVFKVASEAVTSGDMDDIGQIRELLMAHSDSFGTMGILILIAIAFWILWIVWMARDSQPGENQWGPNPKEMPSNEPQNLY